MSARDQRPPSNPGKGRVPTVCKKGSDMPEGGHLSRIYIKRRTTMAYQCQKRDNAKNTHTWLLKGSKGTLGVGRVLLPMDSRVCQVVKAPL